MLGFCGRLVEQSTLSGNVIWTSFWGHHCGTLRPLECHKKRMLNKGAERRWQRERGRKERRGTEGNRGGREGRERERVRARETEHGKERGDRQGKKGHGG